MERQESIQIVNDWLREVSRVMEADISLDGEGFCSFKIGDDVIVMEVSYDFPLVHLYSPLVPFPLEDQEATVGLVMRALEVNAFQGLTRGGAIATPPGGGFLIYCYSMPIEGADAEKLSAVLSAFYETLPQLKEQLSLPAKRLE